MKAIAIIEIPDDGFEKGKWYIDGYIRYTEDESTMKRFDKDMIHIKPLPKKKNTDFHPNIVYANGWNDCIEELEKC